jgi:hypothetical protein
VEELRAKTVAGTDRFEVENVDESIEPRLEALKAVFKEPGSASAKAALSASLAPRFGASPLSPLREKSILERPGISVREGEFSSAAEPLDADRFQAQAQALIAPLAKVETAAFKVIQIQGGFPAGPVTSTVLYELGGEDPKGMRYQWTGQARLAWELERDESTSSSPLRSWRLGEWKTVAGLRAILAAKPFLDVTSSALAASPAYQGLLMPSIDELRERLDAASGIDVYGHHGLAVGDADGDGLDDLYVAMPPGVPNLLFEARGDGTFLDKSKESGADVLDGTSQALFLDVENDGDEDLFLVIDNGALLLQNDGKGKYHEAPDGVPDLAPTRSTPISAAAADYDLDGFIDVYICSYVFWRGAVGEVGSRLPFPYHEAHNGAPNILLRNKGDGTFEDATAKAALDVDNSRFSFASSWGDFDGDGDPDLYVANDFGSKNLYRNNGNGTFTEVTREAGVEDAGAGMSVAWEDYDNDGDLDLYVGNMFSSAGRRVTGTADYKAEDPVLQSVYRRHARGNSLFRNRGDGTFEDVSEETRAFFGRWAWASGFIDFNLDGREDIFVQNGFITNERNHDL